MVIDHSSDDITHLFDEDIPQYTTTPPGLIETYPASTPQLRNIACFNSSIAWPQQTMDGLHLFNLDKSLPAHGLKLQQLSFDMFFGMIIAGGKYRNPTFR